MTSLKVDPDGRVLNLTDPDLFDHVMRVNVRGVYLMARAVAPQMIKQRSGSIINMSSSIAEIGLARRVSQKAHLAVRGRVQVLVRRARTSASRGGALSRGARTFGAATQARRMTCAKTGLRLLEASPAKVAEGGM